MAVMAQAMRPPRCMDARKAIPQRFPAKAVAPDQACADGVLDALIEGIGADAPVTA